MHFLCRFGLHRWDIQTTVDHFFVIDWTRCERAGCRYRSWRVVNIEPRRR